MPLSLGESRAQNNPIIDCRLDRGAAHGVRRLEPATARGRARAASDGSPRSAARALSGATGRTASPRYAAQAGGEACPAPRTPCQGLGGGSGLDGPDEPGPDGPGDAAEALS